VGTSLSRPTLAIQIIGICAAASESSVPTFGREQSYGAKMDPSRGVIRLSAQRAHQHLRAVIKGAAVRGWVGRRWWRASYRSDCAGGAVRSVAAALIPVSRTARSGRRAGLDGGQSWFNGF